MTPELHAAIMAHVSATPGEACGLLVWDGKVSATYHPCRNTSPEGDRFSIHIEDWCAAEDAGEILGVVHSHPDGNLQPSPWDLHSATIMGKAWWIFNPEGKWFRFPGRLPLSGRPYAWGVSDCLTLVQDWCLEQGARIPDPIRVPHYWEQGLDPFQKGLEGSRFSIVEGDPQRGDVLLFGNPARHAGVYIGHGKFLHHREGQLSRAEALDGYWQKAMRIVRAA